MAYRRSAVRRPYTAGLRRSRGGHRPLGRRRPDTRHRTLARLVGWTPVQNAASRREGTTRRHLAHFPNRGCPLDPRHLTATPSPCLQLKANLCTIRRLMARPHRWWATPQPLRLILDSAVRPAHRPRDLPDGIRDTDLRLFPATENRCVPTSSRHDPLNTRVRIDPLRPPRFVLIAAIGRSWRVGRGRW